MDKKKIYKACNTIERAISILASAGVSAQRRAYLALAEARLETMKLLVEEYAKEKGAK